MLIDTHAHLQFNAYKDDLDKVVERCKEKGTVVNTVGTHKDTSAKAVELANKTDNIFATIGLHPIHLFSKQVDEEESSFVSREEKFDYEYYKKLAEHPKVIGIGECGIDLFHIPTDIPREEVIAKQTEVFLQQAKLAKELNLPLVIHTRDAYEEILTIIQENNVSNGVIHCYSGNWRQAEQFLNFGFYLGFTGIITFPPKKKDPQPHLDLLTVVKKAPLDKILVETDCPYLAPIPYRGQKGEPWMVEEVAKKIAELREISVETVIKTVNDNAKKLFTKLKIS